MTDLVCFTVKAEEIVGGWRFTVDADNDQPVEITTPSAKLGTRLAASVMLAVIDPDPLEAQFRLPSAPDGPPPPLPPEAVLPADGPCPDRQIPHTPGYRPGDGWRCVYCRVRLEPHDV